MGVMIGAIKTWTQSLRFSWRWPKRRLSFSLSGGDNVLVK
jgi:hypothetical protein